MDEPTKDCIFCQIVNGSLPSDTVFENEDTLAFLNIQPVHPGHVLVIPKEHYENIYELPELLVGRLFLTAKRTAQAVKKAMSADGVNVNMNNDAAAGQEIFHAHIHIIPRFQSDNLQMWKGKRDYGKNKPKVVARKIAEEFKQ